MSTAQEARALADALRAEYLDGVLSSETLPRAAAMLEAQAAEIGRLNALAGPAGKSLGELERINDDLIADNERLTAERDSLLAALEELVGWQTCAPDAAVDAAHAAIANATGAKEPGNG